jgi:hypothetical protein
MCMARALLRNCKVGWRCTHALYFSTFWEGGIFRLKTSTTDIHYCLQ